MRITVHILHLCHWLMLGLGITLASCKHFDEPEPKVEIPPTPNISIADLRLLVDQQRVTIDEPIIIAGYVTTSDQESNFYRSFYIEDGSGGAEVMAGLYDLHNIYPVGSYVSISLEGCAVGLHNSVLQIGTESASYSQYPTDYFASRVLLDRHVKGYNKFSSVAPKPISFSDFSSSLCGCLINMHDLQFVYNATEEQSQKWSGYSIFADHDGNAIAVYTSSSASYAHKSIPLERVNITGILQYGDVEGEDMYIIKMRYEKDCMLAD